MAYNIMERTVDENSRLLSSPLYDSNEGVHSTWTILGEKIKMKTGLQKSYFLIAGAFVVLVSLSAVLISNGSTPNKIEVLKKNGGTGNVLQLALGESSVVKESLNVTSNNLDSPNGEIEAHDDSIVETPLGKVMSVPKISRDGRKFFAFYKVPYAKPPLKDLMFQPPQQGGKWAEIRRETEVAPQCIQKVKYSTINESSGELDCLYMNIYTPHIPKSNENVKNLMPTLVYIHGGGVVSGNGSRYGPEYFMDEDVVIVNFNFRIGILGFLNIGDGITGNMGYKDQVMALKWIQAYIEYFGGDPKKVLIFGNSSGGAAVGFHFLSKMSTGLFNRAILQSGGSLLAGAVDSNPEITIEAIGEATGCSTNPRNEFLQCLRNVNSSELAVLSGKSITYGLTLEMSSKEDAFISDYPLNILQSGKINKASTIIGVNSAEGLGNSLIILKYPELTNTLNENWTEIAPELLHYHSSAIDPDDMSLNIKDFYFGINNIGNDTTTNLTNLFTDRNAIHRAKVEAVYNAAVNNVYLYLLTKESPKSYSEKIKEGFPSIYYGPSHADEIQFLFPYYDYPYISKDSKYYNFSKSLVKTWSRFADTGKPYTAWQDWKPIRPDEDFVDFYKLDDQSEMVDILAERMKFWDQFSVSDLNYI